MSSINSRKNPLLVDNVKPNDPARSALAWTPDDDKEIPGGCRGFYVGATGDIAVEMIDGGQVVFADIAAGVLHSIAVKKILSTGTEATGIIVLK